MPEPWLGRVAAPVNNGIAIEEVHGIQAYDSEVSGDNLDLKPAAILERVALLFRDEPVPDLTVSVKPLVGAGIEDVMRKEVVVSKSRDDRYIHFPALAANGLDELVRDKAIRTDHSLGISGVLLVAIMPSCIACPDNEVHVIFDVVANPV